LDDIIWPVMNPLKMSLIELTIYLSNEEMKPFKAINQNLIELNGTVGIIFDEPLEDRNPTQLVNDFHLDQLKYLALNDKLLKEIGEKTRTMFYN